MEQTLSLGPIIAKRDFMFIRADGSREAVTLSIGAPFSGGGDDWVCPYLIKGDSFQRFFRMFGVDSMQALMLTLNILQDEMDTLARKHAGAFQYLDGEDLMLVNLLQRST
ncbi:hypothetical protein ASF73_16885 [Xanthomonas sp. Leaf131]|nr:hypothetical protein ASF73_16885 [Xanthomonas sp. Leaf131]